MTKNYKLLNLFLVLNIAFQLLSDVTAGRIISVFGFGVSVTVLYFPITYIISDIITEVYGYIKAKHILMFTLLASIILGCFSQIMLAIPPAKLFENEQAYDVVFSIVPRVLIGGWLAVYFGDISNNYVLAKVKLLTKGRYLWIRTISSTIVGQFINTAIFYTVALSGTLTSKFMLQGILAGWIIKTLLEAVLTPITYLVINKVKRVEKEDYYDKNTDFNPFNLK